MSSLVARNLFPVPLRVGGFLDPSVQQVSNLLKVVCKQVAVRFESYERIRLKCSRYTICTNWFLVRLCQPISALETWRPPIQLWGPVMAVWRRSPQQGPGTESLVRGQKAKLP